MPTETERRAAQYLYNRGWVDPNLSTDERNRARSTFVRGMQQGFKDRAYQFNWTVWRTEYERTGYPPGSFTPRDPNYRDPSVFQATGGTTPAEQRRLRRQFRQNRGQDMRGFGQTGDEPRQSTPMRGFGQTGDTPRTSEPMRGFGESERAYRKRVEEGQTREPRRSRRDRDTRPRPGESYRDFMRRMRDNGN